MCTFPTRNVTRDDGGGVGSAGVVVVGCVVVWDGGCDEVEWGGSVGGCRMIKIIT